MFRHEVRPQDEAAVRSLVAATGMFHADEVEIAAELVRERLRLGAASGYHFVVAEADDGALEGYACYGKVPCTRQSWDLYWIAVGPARQGQGLGRRLLAAVEERVRAAGGLQLYADTAGRAAYAPTRAFYEGCGFSRAACLEDFYDLGDAKVVYAKRLAP